MGEAEPRLSGIRFYLREKTVINRANVGFLSLNWIFYRIT